MTTKAHFEAIGRVAYQWSHLEIALQTAIAVVAEINQDKALIITNSGSVKSWTEILRRLVEHAKCEEALCRRTKRLCDLIAETLYPKRNFIVHGLWQVSWEELLPGDKATHEADDRKAFVHGIKKSGKHMLVGAHVTPADVSKIASEIKVALDDLQDLTMVLACALRDKQR